jgi:hypothetical protein
MGLAILALSAQDYGPLAQPFLEMDYSPEEQAAAYARAETP